MSRTTDNKLVLKQEGKNPVTYDLSSFESEGDFIEAISGRLIGGDLSEVTRVTGSDAARYGSNETSLIDSDVTFGDVLTRQEKTARVSNALDVKMNKTTPKEVRLNNGTGEMGTKQVDKFSFRSGVLNPVDLRDNILEEFPELDLTIKIDGDKLNLKIIAQNGQEIVRTIEANRYTDSRAQDSKDKFIKTIKEFYKLAGKENELIGLNATSMPEAEVEEAEVEEAEESTGAMSTFVKKKDESVNKGKSLKEAGKQQPTTPAVNASTDPGKSNYEHLIAMEEGFGGAPNAQGQATSLAGVYNEDQAKEYENSTTQVINYSKSTPNNKVMAFYGEKSNKNKNPKRGLRTDVTPQVYDDLSDNTKLILQTEHFNMHWDPRVLLLQTAGMLGNNTRGELHNDGDLLLTQWNSVINDPEKLAKFKEALEGNEEELLNNLEKIMKGTAGNQDQYKKRIAYLRNLL
jgi:hypothetical protein